MWNRRIALAAIVVVFSSPGIAYADLFDKLVKKAEEIAEVAIDDSLAESTPQQLPPNNPLSLLDPTTQSCRGRLGRGCGGPEDPLITRNPSQVLYPCDGDPSLVCVDSRMSMGSIKHDMCCDAQVAQGKDGWMCWGGLDKKREGAACKAEWDQALLDFEKVERFPHTWRYKVGSSPTGEPYNWWFGLAPDGTKVSQNNPSAEQIYCHGNHVVQERGVWVCGDASISETSTDDSTTLGQNQATAGGPTSTFSSKSESDFEIYGLRLGMSLEDVLQSLASRHPMLNEPRSRNNDFYRIQNSPNNHGTSLTASVSGPNNSETYIITAKFMPEFPSVSDSNFAWSISFSHQSPNLGFSPLDFVSKKYGEFVAGSLWSEKKLTNPPSFRGGATQLVLTETNVSKYSILFAWEYETFLAYREEYKSKRAEAQENERKAQSKAEEPF